MGHGGCSVAVVVAASIVFGAVADPYMNTVQSIHICVLSVPNLAAPHALGPFRRWQDRSSATGSCPCLFTGIRRTGHWRVVFLCLVAINDHWRIHASQHGLSQGGVDVSVSRGGNRLRQTA